MGTSVLYRVVEGQRVKYTRMLPSDCMVQCSFWAVHGYLSGQRVPCSGTYHHHVQKSPFMNPILSQFNLFHIITIYNFFLSFHMFLGLTSTFFSCFRTRILLIILVCPSVLQVALNRFFLIRWLCVSPLSEGQQIAPRDRFSLSWFCRWPHKPWPVGPWHFLLLQEESVQMWSSIKAKVVLRRPPVWIMCCKPLDHSTAISKP
jgi:hypothetical protein